MGSHGALPCSGLPAPVFSANTLRDFAEVCWSSLQSHRGPQILASSCEFITLVLWKIYTTDSFKLDILARVRDSRPNRQGMDRSPFDYTLIFLSTRLAFYVINKR